MKAKLTAAAIKPLLWTSGGLLVAVLAMAGALVVQEYRARAVVAQLTADRDVLQAAVEASATQNEGLVETNTRQQRTVEDLAAKLGAAISETERLDEKLEIAERALVEAHAGRDDALRRITAERERDYASHPDCNAWGAAAVCGRVSGSVREQWQSAQSTAARRP